MSHSPAIQAAALSQLSVDPSGTADRAGRTTHWREAGLLFAIVAAIAAALLAAAAPALAQCASGSGGALVTSTCNATVSNNGTAVGALAKATEDSTVAFGAGAKASGFGSTALGWGANASGAQGIAIGQQADAGAVATTLGFQASSASEGATSIGAHITNTGVYATAVGGGTDFTRSAVASGNYSVALGGGDSTTSVYGFLAVGALASGLLSVAVGNGAAASDVSAIAIGPGSVASGPETLAIGLLASTTVVHATAVGRHAAATNDAATAVGNFSLASGVGASSFGTGSVAGADSSVAVGRDSSAPATDSATYGARSIASGKSSTAVGTESDARGASSLALGSGARATKKGAVALGSGSVGDIADAVSVGHKNHERRVINVATAVDPTDAVNLKQVKALIKAAGLSGTMMSTLRVPISGLPVSGPAHGAKLDTVAMLHSGSGTQAGAEPASGHNRPVTGRSEDIEPSTVVGWAKMKHDGSLVASRNVVGHARQGIGVYEIAFKTQSLAQCVYNATLHGAGLVSVNEGSLPNSLKVETRNHLGIPADLAFHLTATC